MKQNEKSPQDGSGGICDAHAGHQGITRFSSDSRLLILVLLAGAGTRLLAWGLAPASEFGHWGDEVSYYRTGLMLAFWGTQDLFWAPMMGWVIAFLVGLFQTSYLPFLRFIWAGVGIANLVMVYRLAKEIRVSGASGPTNLPDTFVVASAGFYAVYLTAISYSVHVTGEVLSLFFLLIGLMFLGVRDTPQIWQAGLGGLAVGLAILTRPNLAPLVLTLGGALWWRARAETIPRIRRRSTVAVFLLCGGLLPGLWVVRNFVVTGRPFLNLSYLAGMERGSRGVHDLNLFSPSPTQHQIDLRRDSDAHLAPLDDVLGAANRASTETERRRILEEDLLHPPAYVIDDYWASNRTAIRLISNAPLTNVRRLMGRASRMMAPKANTTDLFVRSRPLTYPPKLLLLVFANLQWAAVALAGIAGLLTPHALPARGRVLLVAVVVGASFASLFAVAEPRYSFPFEFALLLSAIAFLSGLRQNLTALFRKKASLISFFVVSIFLLWSWIAAAIWALHPGILPHW